MCCAIEFGFVNIEFNRITEKKTASTTVIVNNKNKESRNSAKNAKINGLNDKKCEWDRMR